MSRTKQNIPKSARGVHDFWSRRPGSGYFPLGGLAKRIIRRIERSRKRKIIEKEIELEEIDI